MCAGNTKGSKACFSVGNELVWVSHSSRLKPLYFHWLVTVCINSVSVNVEFSCLTLIISRHSLCWITFHEWNSTLRCIRTRKSSNELMKLTFILNADLVTLLTKLKSVNVTETSFQHLFTRSIRHYFMRNGMKIKITFMSHERL